MPTILIIIAVFFGVAALAGGVAVMFRGDSDDALEDRLEMLTGAGGAGVKGKKNKDASLLSQAMARDHISYLETFSSRVLNLRLLLEQADVGIPTSKFLMFAGGLAVGVAVLSPVLGLHPLLAPLAGLAMGFLPVFWLIFKRKKRWEAFAKQLPDALELLARALRAGHSLGAGFQLVATEMNEPISKEFGQVYEEQNLGIPFDDAMDDMCDRITNIDLRFFVTAVILQRQTGGDLAEILDKIGYIIRERFKIWGAVQALTGEGRISGVVLLGLPPVLFLTIYRVNPEYIQILFEDPLGKKLLVVAIFLQFVGALVIRKIINIKV